MTTLTLSQLLGRGGRYGPYQPGNYVYYQNTPSALWTVQHNLGQKYVVFQVFDIHDEAWVGRYDHPAVTFIDQDTISLAWDFAATGGVVIGCNNVGNIGNILSSGNVSVINQSGYLHTQTTSSALWTVQHNLGQNMSV